MCGPVEEIVVGGCPFFEDHEWRFTYLPIRFGGCVCTRQYRLPHTILLLLEHNLGCYKIIFWVIVGGMDSDFDNALDDLGGTIPNFDVSSFTCKDTVFPKARHVLASSLCCKSFQDFEVKFDMSTRQDIFRVFASTTSSGFSSSYPFDVRHVWILLRSMQFIVRNFLAWRIYMILLGMSFLIYSSGQEY